MFFKHELVKSFSLVKQAYTASRPGRIFGLFSGNNWRYDSMGKTLDQITDLTKWEQLHQRAHFNLNQWQQKKTSSPKRVEVMNKDWGLATLEATKEHGKRYAVLNMANPVFPGGSVLEGGSAQEENMWHRSDCATSLLDEGIELDGSKSFRYKEKQTQLLEAKITMSAEEHRQLKNPCAAPIAYKTYFCKNPRVCFRGPEVILDSIDEFDHFKPVPHPELSYRFLPPEDIFPFCELRSAAPELRSRSEAWNKPGFDQYKSDLRRRIASQLDTLILEGQAYVILGAWGCGEFKNDPTVVAQIYAEEIEQRANFFEHIVFAIINRPHVNHNFEVFQQKLLGMNLSSSPIAFKNP